MAADDGPLTYRPRKPSSAPSQGSLAERDAFTALARQSLSEVRASAEAWRNGSAAFLTLVTTGVIIKGRDTVAGLPTSWRILVTVFIGGGLALAVAGLWRVLAAQAGTRYRLSTREDIRRTYGTVETYQVALAAQATGELGTGRRLVAAALVLLLTGVGVSWWAPPTPPDRSANPKITFSGVNAFAAVRSIDRRQIRLALVDNNDPIILPSGAPYRGKGSGMSAMKASRRSCAGASGGASTMWPKALSSPRK